MLKKRIIPCLDIKDGRTVKGVQFEGLRDAGDPVALAQKYVIDGADELVFLDISATNEQRKTFAALVLEIARVINIPFTVGGGISTLEDVDRLIISGADKISINTAAINNPDLITQIAHKYGSQCVVVAMDVKKINNEWKVFKNGGRIASEIDALSWSKIIEDKGAGEILLTSMNNDGTHDGFALDITASIADTVNIPIIASGGAGCKEDFQKLFEHTKANAALAASVFHFNTIPIPYLKQYLQTKNISVR